MWITSSTTAALKPTAIALGNFDGVHRGHQRVMQPILKPVGTNQETGIATVVTFNPHPREFFTGISRKLLTPRQEKVRQLDFLEIKQLVLLPFNRELAAFSPQEFVAKILVSQLQATHVSVGADFRFGKQRVGTALDLRTIASQFGIPVTIADLKKYQLNQDSEQVRISSSRIREALSLGEIEAANLLLGRPYTLAGKVVTGQQLGRTIGFPTANLQLPEDKFLPRQGVYCVKVILGTKQVIKGVMNLGCRPTVDGINPTVEVHLLDWSGDLYSQEIIVSLQKFIRPEQKFASLDDLKKQIATDCATARDYLEAE